MKKTLKILGIVVVVLALAFVALDLSLGKIVLKGANAAAPSIRPAGSGFAISAARHAAAGPSTVMTWLRTRCLA